MAMLAKLLSGRWTGDKEHTLEEEGPTHFASILKQGVPEMLREVDEQVASGLPDGDPPRNPRKDDDRSEWARWAPRWALVASTTILGGALLFVCGAWLNAVTIRATEQEQNMRAAIAEAKTRADAAELQRIQKLETQYDQLSSVVLTLIGSVDKVIGTVRDLERTIAVDQAQHAKQAEYTVALTKQLETLNSNMQKR